MVDRWGLATRQRPLGLVTLRRVGAFHPLPRSLPVSVPALGPKRVCCLLGGPLPHTEQPPRERAGGVDVEHLRREVEALTAAVLRPELKLCDHADDARDVLDVARARMDRQPPGQVEPVELSERVQASDVSNRVM